VSCYLDLGHGALACRHGLRKRARALRATLPGSTRLDFDAALAPIASYANAQVRADARGAAIFSRSAHGGAIFLALQFAAPLPDSLTAGLLPDLVQLMTLQNRHNRYAVMLMVPPT
jgi:hypothetical protein